MTIHPKEEFRDYLDFELDTKGTKRMNRRQRFKEEDGGRTEKCENGSSLGMCTNEGHNKPTIDYSAYPTQLSINQTPLKR